MARLARRDGSFVFLRRHAPILLTGLLGAGAIGVGCTQNFGIFEPSGTSSTTTGTGGSGGTGTTTATTTTTGTGGAGGSTTTSTTSTTSTTGTGGMGGSTTTSTTSTTSTTGTGGMGPENCVNGVDDDGDGKVDCEDLDCSPEFTCAPGVPPSWNGLVTLFSGNPAMAPADCPPEHPVVSYKGNDGLISEPASCSACSCSAPAVTCTVGVISFRNQGGCANDLGNAAQPGDGMCGPINPPAAIEGYAAQNPTGSAGACGPSGGTPTIPPPKWQKTALACTGGGQGGGCGPQNACVARSGAPFGAGTCVWKSGDKSCPAGFPQKHVFIDDVIDNRDCTACSCGAGSATCTVVTSVYASADCSGASLAEVPNNQTCVAGGQGASVKPTVTKSGSCPASGGQPTGSVQEGNTQTTVCCTQ